MPYWLFKTEPAEFSIDDLANAPAARTRWDGIRNYQARNFLRDQVRNGDSVLLYHSRCKPTAIVGWAKVVSDAYPDPAQFDPESTYYDSKSTTTNPRWFCVDIQFQQKLSQPLTLAAIKSDARLAQMVLLKQGRLSIQPVTPDEFEAIAGNL